MKTQSKSLFFVIVVITLLIAVVAFFGIHSDVMGINLKGANEMRWGIDIKGGVDAVLSPKNLDRAPTAEELEAARAVIETRLDQKNILDRDVATDKDNGSIIVRFPWKTGETEFDPSTAIEELGEMAQLTFREPDGTIILTGKDVKSNTSITRASSGMYYNVNIELTSEGSAAFSEATARLVGQPVSIYMDEDEISHPNVKEQINTTQFYIEGAFSRAEAQKLANQIAAGALPFALTTNNYVAISPALGSNALNVMLWAGLTAFLLICVFMVLYYRLSGIVAIVALTLQMTGTLMILAIPQITVTLQGIAGIILTIGMGVDANIVIAERIREELRSGKTLDSAISAGFKRAFSAVFDGNLTTLLVAVVMMIFGSGAILSFAITLFFGILMNFVAGVFANRLMTQSITRFPVFRKSSWFLGKGFMTREPKMRDFYGKRKVTFLISGAVIAFGIVMLFVNHVPRDGLNLDIQFKGGAIFRYNAVDANAINPDEAASLASSKLDNRPVSGQITTNYGTGATQMVLNLTAGNDLSSEAISGMETALKEKYPDQNLTLAESNNVSAYYGQKFLRNGIIAIILSCILIVLYTWFSFRRIHGLSAGAMALVALLHDVVIVFFAFVIFNIPIGDTFIAVVLTILGYSVNDTIIIFDRVRENALFDPSMPPDTLVNRSISQTLTRSINTTMTVFISLVVIYVFAVVNSLESIQRFALPMAIGIFCGAYSSMCVAGPLWTMWQKAKQRSSLAKKRKV